MFDFTFAEKYGAPAGKFCECFSGDIDRVLEKFNKQYPKIRRVSMLKQLDTSDWQCAFAVSTTNIQAAYPTSVVSLEPFCQEDVVEIHHLAEGEREEEDWILVGRLKDNRWFALVAGCDYTGRNYQTSGMVTMAFNYDVVVRYGLSIKERSQLGIVI